MLNRAAMEQQLTKLAQVVSHKAQKFFAQNRKGENYELKAELNSGYSYNRKEAVKKVIANMTIGKDVSPLFADVVKNMQTDDIEMKKLVYLYLINYAKTQPELVILAVNTFVKDSSDPNPLIRALAIRTMGCLRVAKIIDYIAEPLRKALNDESPYVRKTGAICVAKLYDIEPEVAIDNGFVERLSEMLSDNNPTVVANSLCALTEIAKSASAVKDQKSPFVLDAYLSNKLVLILNECTEWGQISILEVLATYRPKDVKEADAIIDKVLPRLSHRNAAVVLAGVRLLLNYVPLVSQNNETRKTIFKKMTPPLITLLNAEAEITYIALRNLRIILEMTPDLLGDEIKIFFCKYNDATFVKTEKLEMMVRLCTERHVDTLLGELKEYAVDVDEAFSKLAIRAIAQIGFTVTSAADRCNETLVALLDTKLNYVVQETIIALKDLMRKFSNRFAAQDITLVAAQMEECTDPEAKAAWMWLIGEHAERVQNIVALIEPAVENVKYEAVQVQLQILSAMIKIFLKFPAETSEMVQRLLKSVSLESDHADLRDRAYMYWRLISQDPHLAKSMILSQKESFQIDPITMPKDVLEELIVSIGQISSVYHRKAATFLSEADASAPTPALLTAEDLLQDLDGADNTDGQLVTDLQGAGSGGASAAATGGGASASSGMHDLLDLAWDASPASASVMTPVASGSTPTTNSTSAAAAAAADPFAAMLFDAPMSSTSSTSSPFGAVQGQPAQLASPPKQDDLLFGLQAPMTASPTASFPPSSIATNNMLQPSTTAQSPKSTTTTQQKSNYDAFADLL